MSQINVNTIALANGTEQARLVQVVNVMDGAVATTTTAMAHDDTIPQNTEGEEFMTLAITPTHASNKLVIEAKALCSNGTAARTSVMALFQDSTAGALASVGHYEAAAGGQNYLTLTHYMTTGTTSETTFKVRAGSTSGTMTFNGHSGGRMFGGVASSSITISEIRV